MERFVDREDELSRLRGCYDSDDADMVVIFGRRRLGKTELVRESLEDRDDAVLYQATETTRQIQLDAFVDVAAESIPGSIGLRASGSRCSGILLTRMQSSCWTNSRI